MESRMIRIPSPSGKLSLKIVPGHFATTHAHTNFYVDMTTLKTRQSEAGEVAYQLAGQLVNSCIIDTVLCLDGTEVVGAYLAEELCRNGVQSMNQHATIYIVSPEYCDGQMVVRDNILPMILNKNVLLLSATVSSGISLRKSIESIAYYGGRVSALASIFSAVTECEGLPIHTVFSPENLPDYQSYPPHQCPYCLGGQKLDALVNAYGYSKL